MTCSRKPSSPLSRRASFAKVQILKHYPSAALCCFEKSASCAVLLSLAHRIFWRCSLRTRLQEKHKENRDGRRGLAEGLFYVEGRLLHVLNSAFPPFSMQMVLFQLRNLCKLSLSSFFNAVVLFQALAKVVKGNQLLQSLAVSPDLLVQEVLEHIGHFRRVCLGFAYDQVQDFFRV